jgi:hypothetical protein
MLRRQTPPVYSSATAEVQAGCRYAGTMKFTRLLLLAAVLALVSTAHAIEIKVSAKALERTLNAQLFNGPDGRYYFRGNPDSPCYAYAQDPKVTFKDERIVIHMKTHAKLGAQIKHDCLGVDFKNDADVSVIPEAILESIGFRDPRIESLSGNKELDYFLVPFLSKKLPQEMKINIAVLLRQLLLKSAEATGYDMKLDNLKIHSMQVSGDALVVDFDGDLSVN